MTRLIAKIAVATHKIIFWIWWRGGVAHSLHSHLHPRRTKIHDAASITPENTNTQCSQDSGIISTAPLAGATSDKRVNTAGTTQQNKWGSATAATASPNEAFVFCFIALIDSDRVTQ